MISDIIQENIIVFLTKIDYQDGCVFDYTSRMFREGERYFLLVDGMKIIDVIKGFESIN